ncbi:hypothetical protein GVX82_02350, partial [Patescibacteria group bacterium]|jgi:hypothetical protein|nr:hypothetical protein [Patescibacteria group bacterium]
VGVLFLVIGVAIVLGFDKDLEVWVLDTVGFLPGTFEQNLLDQVTQEQ